MVFSYVLLLLFILMISYLVFLLIQLVNNFRNKFYFSIIIGQFGFFFFLLAVLFVRLQSFEQNLVLFDGITLLSVIVKLGAVSALIGMIYWLNAIELLGFSDFFMFSQNITIKKLPFILIGLTMGSILIDLDVRWVLNHYELWFKTPTVYLLMVISFGIFVVEQTSFFISRLKAGQIFKLKNRINKNVSLLTLSYIASILLAFFIAVAQYVGLLPQSYPIWLVVGIVSQMLFSLVLFKFPFLFLTTEVPVSFMIISEGGIAIYSKTFIEKFIFSEQLIAGYLKALDSLGSNVLSESGDATEVAFQKKTSIIVRTVKFENSISKFCYIYNGVSYLAQHRLDSFIELMSSKANLKEEINSCIQNNRILQANSDLEALTTKIFSSFS